MSLVLTRAGRVELARSFYRDLVNSNDYFYFSLGNTTEWTDEDSPPTPIDHNYDLNSFRRNLMFIQRATSADICHLCRRIDWESGTVYDNYSDRYSTTNQAYSGAAHLADANFYVITSDFNVYKCIDNNSDSPSTVMPTTTSVNVEETSDGYQWKYLFTVSSSDQTKFLDAEHIPVRKLTTSPYGDVNGEIDSIAVTSGGSGYTAAPAVLILGDGQGATATANISAGEVTSITLNTQGTGYSFCLIELTGGGGSGATAIAYLGDTDPNPSTQSAVESTAVPGSIDRIVVEDIGIDYVINDATVRITGDGIGAEAFAVIDSGTGSIISVDVTNGGTGYSFADISFEQNAGVGTGATAIAVISPIEGHGSNPIKELFADTIGITISLSDNTNEDLVLGNDFRQIGIVKNMSPYANNSIPYTSTTGTACYIIDVDDDSNYNIDDIITTDSEGTFRVIQKTDNGSGTYQIYLQGIVPVITAVSVLENTTTGTTALSINSVTDPEIDVFTGDILYIENRGSVTRDPERVETLKVLIKF